MKDIWFDDEVFGKMSEDELGKSGEKNITIKHILAEFSQLDFCAIYQRWSNVWPMEMKKEFIGSVMCNVPIGWIHLISHPTVAEFRTVCDGKQRLECIHDFRNNKFPIEWKGKEFYYNDFLKPENVELLRRFNDYSIKIMLWPPMTVLKQRDLLRRVNAMVALSAEERLYCTQFLAKSLLTYFFDEIRAHLQNRMGKKIANDERFSGLNWCQGLMCLCFGDVFTSGLTWTHPSSKVRKRSAILVNDMLCKHIGENNLSQDPGEKNPITEDLLKQTGLWENFCVTKKAVSSLAECLSADNGIKEKLDKNALREMLVWLIDHFKTQTLTPSQVRENKRQFYEVFKIFIETRSEKGLTQKQSHLKCYKYKNEYLNQILALKSIDTDVKNKSITQKEKDRALSSIENNKCPCCGCKLDASNIEFDHLQPKSKFGKTTVVCLCKDCNRAKSNLSSKQVANLADYLCKFGS